MANEQNEKTEEATPKRKEKERNKGHIAKSQDFTSSLVLTLSLGLLIIFGPEMLDKLKTMTFGAFNNLNPDNISESDIFTILGNYFKYFVQITALFFSLLAVGAALILRIQTGALFAKEALKPNIQKLLPANMMKSLLDKINIFKPKQMVELTKSLLKTAIVAMCGLKVILKRKDDLFSLIGANVNTGFSVIGSVIVELMATICIMLIIIGIIDKKYQNYEYAKSIKMTKQEVKDEFKNIEGDPKVKGKIRSFRMKILQQQMMSQVQNADVVVVNPTHYAVAIKYDPIKAPAPIVLAKGVDFLAFKIREIAKNNNIPIVENKPLARSLYKMVEINAIIPQEMYIAVAEILQYVYAQKK